MKPRPLVVAFDIIETVFSLENLRGRLCTAGLPGYALEIWFAHILRDAFALEATEVYKPFREIAAATLMNVCVQSGISPASAGLDQLLDGLAALSPHPDARAAFLRLRRADIRIVALTNGSAQVTEKLLQRAQLKEYVERLISIEEVRHWKPSREVYLHAVQCVNVEPRRLALVATHAWDIHGAGQAGLTTAFVARGQHFPGTMRAPDITAETLDGVAEALIRLPALPAAELRSS